MTEHDVGARGPDPDGPPPPTAGVAVINGGDGAGAATEVAGTATGAEVAAATAPGTDDDLASENAPPPPAAPTVEVEPAGDEIPPVAHPGTAARPPGRPWTAGRILDVVTTVVALGVTTWVMLNVVHFNPLNPVADLVFDDNTPTGGDMGAHVWGPAFLRDHLLPNWQLNGWSMDWYAGMPVYRFYMVVPALAIVALDTVLPYGVAFKLVVISGLVALPACCWAFGRLASFRSPIPQLFAFAGMAFALQESYSIYGGNLKSTMAGEFSFSIALSFGVLGLGMLARAMRTGQYRCLAAIVLALGVVSHGIVAIYIGLAALVIVVVHADTLRRWVLGGFIGITVVALSAFWIGPFIGNHAYMTDMKYGFRPDGASDSFWDMFFPFTAPLNFIVTGFAVIGFVASIARRQLTGVALGVIGLLTVALVYLTRDSLPVIGLLWNPRLLPFLYLVELLLMMVGIVEAGGFAAAAFLDRRAGQPGGVVAQGVTFGVTALAVCVVFAFFYEALPGGSRVTLNGQTVYQWGPFHKNAHPDDDDAYQKAQGSGWASYNFKGYEGKPSYPEYHDVVQSMAEIGREEGCGRALWENNSDNGEYGTTMAFMLLPFWTDGCIASMEGLFFEASGTTPYHFLTTAAMSESSSNPVRELRYTNNDASVGVPYLQKLGVRYVMVRTDAAKSEAEARPELTRLAEVGPWEIFEVADAPVVEALSVQPVVALPRGGDERERHLELGTSWFQNPDEWAALPTDDGPAEWQRIEVVVDESRSVPDPNAPADEPDTRGKQVDVVVPGSDIETVELPEVEVSDVVVDEQSVSFHVDRVGVPVLVKVSYFPNWEVSGADGPYRAAPNFMVVVPTENDVELTFGRSSSDLFFYALTVGGIGLLVALRRYGGRLVPPAPAPAADGPPAAPPPPVSTGAPALDPWAPPGGVRPHDAEPDDDAWATTPDPWSRQDDAPSTPPPAEVGPRPTSPPATSPLDGPVDEPGHRDGTAGPVA